MVRALVALGLVLSALLLFRDGLILKDVGLLGSCVEVVTPNGVGGDWRACRSGALDGEPDLSRSGCARQGLIAGVAYWICPAGGDRKASARPELGEL